MFSGQLERWQREIGWVTTVASLSKWRWFPQEPVRREGKYYNHKLISVSRKRHSVSFHVFFCLPDAWRRTWLVTKLFMTLILKTKVCHIHFTITRASGGSLCDSSPLNTDDKQQEERKVLTYSVKYLHIAVMNLLTWLSSDFFSYATTGWTVLTNVWCFYPKRVQHKIIKDQMHRCF